VIDALDECGDKKARKDLLHAITTEPPNLPESVKFLITSRASAARMSLKLDGAPGAGVRSEIWGLCSLT
jgi:hypothetical protein